MRILVTGGAGFIGSHLVLELIAAGNDVTIIDNLSSGKLSNIHEKAVFYHEDITDGERINDIFDKEKPEIVYHLAAQTSVPVSIGNPQQDAWVNIIGSINILDACRRAGVKKYVFMSSAAVYGKPQFLPVDEGHKIKPVSGYGLSKYTGEHYCEMMSELYGFDYLILRCANIYGERQDSEGEGGVISVFMNAVVKGKPLIIHGDGEQTRDFIYVRDVIAAAIRGIRHGSRATVNISTGTGTSINRLIAAIEAVNGSQAVISHEPPRAGDIRNSVLDNARACALLQWKPAYSLDEGLKTMLLHQKPVIM